MWATLQLRPYKTSLEHKNAAITENFCATKCPSQQHWYYDMLHNYLAPCLLLGYANHASHNCSPHGQV